MDNDLLGGKYHALCTEVQYVGKQIRLGYLPAFISSGPISQHLGKKKLQIQSFISFLANQQCQSKTVQNTLAASILWVKEKVL